MPNASYRLPYHSGITHSLDFPYTKRKGEPMFSSHQSQLVRVFSILSVLTIYLSFGIAEEVLIPQQVLDLQQNAEDLIKVNDFSGAITIYEAIAQTYPDSEYETKAKIEISKIYLKQKKMDEAKEAIDGLFKNASSRPEFVGLMKDAGIAFAIEKQPDDAIDIYTRLLDQFPSHELTGEITLYRGWAYLDKKDYTNAYNNIQHVISQHDCSNIVKELFCISRGIARGKKADEALSVYSHLLSQYPDHEVAGQVRLYRGWAHLDKKEYTNAYNDIQQVISQHDCSKVVKELFGVGRIFAQGRKTDEALSIYNHLLIQYPDHEMAGQIRLFRGWAYLDKKDYTKAYDDIQSAISQNDCSAMTEELFGVGRTYNRIGQMDQAISIFTQIINTSAPAGIKIRSHLYRRSGYLKNQDWEKAAEDLQAAKTLFFNSYVEPDHRREIGRDLLMWKMIDEAKKIYQYTIDNYPEDQDAVVGIVACDIINKLETAELSEVKNDMQTLADTYKGNSSTDFFIFFIAEQCYLKAQNALRTGDQEQAHTDFLKAIAIWDMNINQINNSNQRCLAYYYSGAAYKSIGDSLKAATYYQQVVENYPDYEKAWYAQYQIAKCYEELQLQGQSSLEDVRSAYQTLLNKYPDCSAAKIAVKKLNTL